LVGSRDHRTQFWKGAIQGPFHQSLVQIGSVVLEELIRMQKVTDVMYMQPSQPGGNMNNYGAPIIVQSNPGSVPQMMVRLFFFLAHLTRRVTFFFSYCLTAVSLLPVAVVGHNSQRGPSEDHSTIVWAQLAQQFQRRLFSSSQTMVKWSFRIISDNPVRQRRWRPLLEIED
jgi:hypothetical protein